MALGLANIVNSEKALLVRNLMLHALSYSSSLFLSEKERPQVVLLLTFFTKGTIWNESILEGKGP